MKRLATRSCLGKCFGLVASGERRTDHDSCAAVTDEAQLPCPACRGGKATLWGSKNAYPLWRCVGCGTIWTPVGLGGGVAADHYDEHYTRTHFETSRLAVASLTRLVASAERFRQTGRWLDVGYGAGGLLAIAEGCGWACYGTEVSPRALEYGRKRGWVVAADAGADQRFGKGTFDVMTMIEVIEHVTAPVRLLGDAAAWIRPGGLLYLTTPNARSISRWLLGPVWNVFSPPEHLTIWTGQSLGRALGAAGFGQVRIRAEGFNPCEVIARVRGRGESTGPTYRNQVASELHEFLSKTPLRRAVKRGINMGLAAFGIGDGLKVWAVRSK